MVTTPGPVRAGPGLAERPQAGPSGLAMMVIRVSIGLITSRHQSDASLASRRLGTARSRAARRSRSVRRVIDFIYVCDGDDQTDRAA